MNDLLQAELSAFLGYEPYAKAGYHRYLLSSI
ncbi:hypothetical protein [Streptococcus oralis]